MQRPERLELNSRRPAPRDDHSLLLKFVHLSKMLKITDAEVMIDGEGFARWS